MDFPNFPEDPVSAWKTAAIQVHEFFMALQDVGFTEEQAFSLLRDGVNSLGKTQ